MKNSYLFLEHHLPSYWDSKIPARAYLAIVVWGDDRSDRVLKELFPKALSVESVGANKNAVVRAFRNGVSNPLALSLASVLKVEDRMIRADLMLVSDGEIPRSIADTLKKIWREPAIEDVYETTPSAWQILHKEVAQMPERRDDSWDEAPPEKFLLEFEPNELKSLDSEAKARGRKWNRCELELFAQTWSEHCKHKIFAAHIECVDTLNRETDSLFKTHIRQPTIEIMKERPDRYLSVFHDNAGVIALDREDGSPTDWAACLKMETHNSPSAIAPYGGASTGVVGVHRDILGTGLGAMPIANWDVLCFESPEHSEPRPESALGADLIRTGVLKGIEDGGNQSGIPTVQGSVVFDPSFAVKPLVFAGAIGILPKTFVNKKPKVGAKLYCVGGAVGADGLRGAVMSSRDIRSTDFTGSIVQVANAFVQRRVTDFLLEARDLNLIDSITDNGAGGLASSVGEMAQSTGGADIDLTNLRLKFHGLHGWERLVSESQERMTVATTHVKEFEALAQSWDVPFDRLGELTDSKHFRVHHTGKTLVDIRLEFLNEGCPRMHLKSGWTRKSEMAELEKSELPEVIPNVLSDFSKILGSVHLCSREGVVRRFDHEVQGRTLRKPFAGRSQQSPQDGSLLEIYEAGEKTNLVLTHALAPWRKDVEENTVHSFDEALRTAVIAGARLETAGLLDNFCWADPIRNERRLWRLTRCCEVLSQLCRTFKLPLISGKDSMKNNSKDFQALETLVVSLGASSIDKLHVPAGFFSRANDVVFYLPPIRPTLKDSTWERVMGARSEVGRNHMFSAQSAQEVSAELTLLCAELKNRYLSLSKIISEGMIRSAKDISEGGLLTSAFEMCLGRDLGLDFERDDLDPLFWLGEGLGGYVFGIDPHFAADFAARLPEAKRLGVTIKTPQLRFGFSHALDLNFLRETYLGPGRKGFWS